MSWLVIGESVAGTSHHARNVPCQDAGRHLLFGAGDDWLVIAVADGAGSATHAEAGAAMAAESVIRQIGESSPDALISRDGVHALVSAARAELIVEAGRLHVPPREFACTLLLAVVGPESATFAQLGDGAIVLGDGQGYRTAFWPEPGEYANTTDFLTDDGFADALRIDTTGHPVPEVAVLTDGLQRLALDFSTRSPHALFFRPLFDWLWTGDPDAQREPFRMFLDSPRVNERTDDDKTLVLAIHRP